MRDPVVITGRNPVGGRYDDAWPQHAGLHPGRWRWNSAAIKYLQAWQARHSLWQNFQAHRLRPDGLPRITLARGLHPRATPSTGVTSAFPRSLELACKTLQRTAEQDRQLEMSTPPNQAGHARGNDGRHLLTEGRKP